VRPCAGCHDGPVPADRDLGSLPKAHLHLHLDAAMRRATFIESAGAAGIVAVLPRGYGSFAAFTGAITAAAACLRRPADTRRLVHEIVEDAARAGAVWVEPSMWPGLSGGRLRSDAGALVTRSTRRWRASMPGSASPWHGYAHALEHPQLGCESAMAGAVTTGTCVSCPARTRQLGLAHPARGSRRARRPAAAWSCSDRFGARTGISTATGHPRALPTALQLHLRHARRTLSGPLRPDASAAVAHDGG
jgi:hypothetical protein